MKGREKLKSRQLVRWVCLLVALGMLWNVQTARWAGAVPASSPWVVASSVLATWTFHSLAWLGCVVGAVCFLRHRWFCRWVCPTGLCADGASRLGRRRNRKPSRMAPLGQWIAWITLGGALLGYPVFLWLDPLALFTGVFRVGDTGRPIDLSLVAWLPVLGLPLVLVLSALWPNSWCGYVCPLGAFQDVLSSGRRLLRSGLRPAHARKNQGASSSPLWGPPLGRRALLGAGTGAALALIVGRRQAVASRPLRPPGALGEPEFSGVCIRCGNCSRACPPRIIESDLGGHGAASLLTPVLSFRSDYCREDCTRCTDVCPSGALEPMALASKQDMRLGFPWIDMNTCLLGEDRECAECRNRCPYEAVRYVWSETEYSLAPQIDVGKCTGCGACEVACPTRPKRAIVVVPVGPS